MAKLTPLAVLVLGLLRERPMHPYEMYQTLIHRRDDRNCKIRPGTLYHQVGRLADAGLAVADAVEREGNRPERTTYAVTAEGRTALHDQLVTMVAEPAEEYPEFRLALSALHNLAPAEALAALDGRASALALHKAETVAGLEALRGMELAEQKYLDVLYEDMMVTAELQWVRDLAERIRGGKVSWGKSETGGDESEPCSADSGAGGDANGAGSGDDTGNEELAL